MQKEIFMKMKKYISVAIVLLICACGFASCTSIDHQLGKFISTAAIDHLENELSADLDTSYETLERLSDGAYMKWTYTPTNVIRLPPLPLEKTISMKNSPKVYPKKSFPNSWNLWRFTVIGWIKSAKSISKKASAMPSALFLNALMKIFKEKKL